MLATGNVSSVPLVYDGRVAQRGRGGGALTERSALRRRCSTAIVHNDGSRWMLSGIKPMLTEVLDIILDITSEHGVRPSQDGPKLTIRIATHNPESVRHNTETSFRVAEDALDNMERFSTGSLASAASSVADTVDSATGPESKYEPFIDQLKLIMNAVDDMAEVQSIIHCCTQQL